MVQGFSARKTFWLSSQIPKQFNIITWTTYIGFIYKSCSKNSQKKLTFLCSVVELLLIWKIFNLHQIKSVIEDKVRQAYNN